LLRAWGVRIKRSSINIHKNVKDHAAINS
jgi:hypothetical protein